MVRKEYTQVLHAPNNFLTSLKMSDNVPFVSFQNTLKVMLGSALGSDMRERGCSNRSALNLEISNTRKLNISSRSTTTTAKVNQRQVEFERCARSPPERLRLLRLLVLELSDPEETLRRRVGAEVEDKDAFSVNARDDERRGCRDCELTSSSSSTRGCCRACSATFEVGPRAR